MQHLGEIMRKPFGNLFNNDGVDQESSTGVQNAPFDISSFLGSVPLPMGAGIPSNGNHFDLNLTNSNSSSSALHSDGSGQSDVGQLLLLDDDGVISPIQDAKGGKGGGGGSTSGGTTSGGSTGGTTGGTTTTTSSTLVGTAGGLQFNLVWDSSVSSAPAGFKDAAIAAATQYTQLYSNAEVININVGFGEVGGSAIGSGSLASSMSSGYYETYSQVLTGLMGDASSSSWQQMADSTLPATDPTNGGKFFVTKAEAKTFGQISGSSTGVDGYVGLSSSYTFNYAGQPTSGQYDAIGAFEHEISEVMGRVGSVGYAFGSGVYTPLDLFRYSSPGARDLTAGPGYFSVDGGNTNLATYNNPLNGGDAGDWINSLAGDSYGAGYSGMVAALSPTDIIETSILGYRMTPTAISQTQTPGVA
jgi:hypothetical protein